MENFLDKHIGSIAILLNRAEILFWTGVLIYWAMYQPNYWNLSYGWLVPSYIALVCGGFSIIIRDMRKLRWIHEQEYPLSFIPKL
jgi:hypothetical protein